MRLFLIGVILIFTQCNSSRQEENIKIVSFFKENYSYQWSIVEPEKISEDLINSCLNYHKDKIRTGDKLLLKRAYLESYKGEKYLIVEFDFKEAFDSRICFVFSDETKELIGYFERSLA